MKDDREAPLAPPASPPGEPSTAASSPIDAPSSALPGALNAWERRIGPGAVLSAQGGLARYTQNVSGLSRSIAAVLLPGSTEDVKGIVEIANTHRVPIYPISRGSNWGLGSRLPVRDHGVVVDLRRMNKIREVNEEHTYAVIEPGVTQGDLYDHLREKRLPLLFDVTGSSRQTSILGNILDRGVGYFACRYESLWDLELVLGNGRFMRTGFWRYEGAKTAHLLKYGVGPYMDGLFTQSNYGVVTAGTIGLFPMPESQAAFHCRVKDEGRLAQLVEALRGLHRRGVTRSVVHIADEARTRLSLGSVLGDALRGKSARIRELVERQSAPPAWSVVGSIAGSRLMALAAEIEVKRAMRGIGDVRVLTQGRFQAARKVTRALSFLPFFEGQSLLLDAMEPFLGLTQGVPTDAALKSVYAPVKGAVAKEGGDPDESECGLLFCLPVVPFEGEAVVRAVSALRRACAEHGFVPAITLNTMTTKCLEGVVSIAWNRTDEAESAAAKACNDAMHAAVIKLGFHPYRVGIDKMNLAVWPEDTFSQTAADLKAALDPNGIIAPGRYNLR